MAEGAISRLLSTLAPFIRDEFNLLSGVRDEINLIRGEFEQMNAFLQVAGAKEDNDQQFEGWVKQVRDTAYDAGDVLEQFMFRLEYRHGDGFSGFLRKASRFTKTIIARHQIASEVQRIKLTVNEVSRRKRRYESNTHVQGSSSNTVPTTTRYDIRVDALMLRENEIVGITKLKSELIKWLVDKKNLELQVVSVWGMGGLGKTTLVKKVFDDAEIVKHFEVHAWITVSNSFQIEELLKGMINQLFSEVKKQVPDEVKEMDRIKLKKVISSFLKGKRYVIVLDDVWNTNDWDAIEKAFPQDNCSSRVILTTRNRSVASIGKVCDLTPLTLDESWTLFCQKAFQDQSCPPSLEATTKEILKKCGGLPLAIVAIGGLLATKAKSVDEWNKIYRGLDGKHGIDKVLSISYFDLPWPLKLCFLYLSIFPEDYRIDHLRLIRLWIAEGFVQSFPGLTPEEVAGNYLSELLNRSLILVETLGDNGRANRYQVHDIWREMILSMSIKQDLVSIFGAEQHRFPHKVRRLSIHNGIVDWQDIKHIAIHVQSLLMFGPRDSEFTTSIMDSLENGAKLVKVLDLRNSGLFTFPRQIGKLLHLKYLSLSETDIKEVPKSIGDLQMLETLDLQYTEVRQLPNEILKLHRLRHLLVHNNCNDVSSGFKALKGIQKLSCLQTLSAIEVNISDSDVIVRNLAKLTELRVLNILRLKSTDAKELCLTLQKLIELRSLSIIATDENEILDLEPLSLPPRYLNTLFIEARMEKFPQWIPLLDNLTKLVLRNSKFKEDPLLQFQDMPNLTCLILRDAYEGEALTFQAGSFKKLTILWLFSLDGLTRVSIMEGAMPCLKELHISFCPLLEELPSGIETLSSLAKLELFYPSNKLISKLNRDGQNENFLKIAHIPNVLIGVDRNGERYSKKL